MGDLQTTFNAVAIVIISLAWFFAWGHQLGAALAN
jgi:hypothetical protein